MYEVYQAFPDVTKSGHEPRMMRSKPSANRAATAWRLAAQGFANSHSALGAYSRRIGAR